ncbi:MAG: response regulator [Candidatus Omnitrophica bacterium]|nr:response regulator [Candidatus Omnitrophota bacterium]
MANEKLNLLLVEDSPTEAALIQERLEEAFSGKFFIEHHSLLVTAIDRLGRGHIDVVLLDLHLPDSQGLCTVQRVCESVPQVPVVVLTGLDDDSAGVQAVRFGAQDYLVKGHFSGSEILRVLRYAIERHKILEKLKSTQLQLVESAKFESVGRLAQGVAHEVKNPLAILLVGVEYLAEKIPGDKDLLGILENMDRAIRRADKIINGLVDLSVERELRFEVDDLNIVVEHVLLLLTHDLARAQITVIPRLVEGLPPVLVNRGRLEQVFISIFLNSIYAMADGGVLKIKTAVREVRELDKEVGSKVPERLAADQKVVVVEIEDSGPGIGAEEMEKVFDPFFTTKPTGQGPGLGLSVARKIMELHKGIIYLANRPEGGVRATLIFEPAARQEQGSRAGTQRRPT